MCLGSVYFEALCATQVPLVAVNRSLDKEPLSRVPEPRLGGGA